MNDLNLEELIHTHTNKITDDVKNYIIENTQFIDSQTDNKIPLKLRIWHLLHNSIKIPQCKSCDNRVWIKKDKFYIDNPYTEYCCDTCRQSGRQLINDRDWLFNQHITLKKSAMKIADEIGTSSVPVINALKRLNISHVNYTKVTNDVQNKLIDYDLMKSLYSSKNMQEIADEIGTSKATISIWMNKHGIDIKNPNDYDRPFTKISKPHNEIIEFIKSISDTELLINNRTTIGGNNKELDIYIPEFNFAIEFNGFPFHTQYFGKKDRNYHFNKTLECNKLGIHLFHVWSTDWTYKRRIVESMIRTKLKRNNRLYARLCDVRHVDSYDGDRFIDENHIQGKSTTSKVYIGLYHENELVSLMTFSKPRFNKNYDWELIRFCNKLNTTVIGGASRLLSNFRKKYNGSIISYADSRYSDGGLYKTLGFELTNINKPSYKYYNKGVLHNRYGFQKKYLKNKLNTYDPNLTELDNMLNNGYDLVWDCGTKTFINI